MAVLAFVVASILMPLFVVAIARNETRLDRKDFAVRLLMIVGGFVMAMILVIVIKTTLDDGSDLTILIAAFVAFEWLAFMFLLVWGSIQRGRAIGHPKMRSLRYMIPIIGLYYAVVLVKARDDVADATSGVVTKG